MQRYVSILASYPKNAGRSQYSTHKFCTGKRFQPKHIPRLATYTPFIMNSQIL